MVFTLGEDAALGQLSEDGTVFTVDEGRGIESITKALNAMTATERLQTILEASF